MVGKTDKKSFRRKLIGGLYLLLYMMSTAGCSTFVSGDEARQPVMEERPKDRQEKEVEAAAGSQSDPAADQEQNADITAEADKIAEDKPEDSSEAVRERLEDALLPEEVLIDWVQEVADIYAIVHSKGETEYGDTLLILREEDGALKRTYANDFSGLMPWKIDSADIDGDLERELLIAVRKTTAYDKVIKNRMFIFNYRDGVLVKKWTGSQIAGTWRDFYAEDLLDAPGDELIFLEELTEGQERIKVYHWFDFGFFLLGESGEYTAVREVTVSGENNLLVTLEQGRTFHLTMKKGKLLETKEASEEF